MRFFRLGVCVHRGGMARRFHPTAADRADPVSAVVGIRPRCGWASMLSRRFCRAAVRRALADDGSTFFAEAAAELPSGSRGEIHAVIPRTRTDVFCLLRTRRENRGDLTDEWLGRYQRVCGSFVDLGEALIDWLAFENQATTAAPESSR